MKVRNKYTGEVLEAFQYDGDMQNSDGEYYVPEWAVEALKTGKLYYANMDAGGMPPLCVKHELVDCDLLVVAGDYVVKFEDGRIRPYSAKDFEKIYEIVKDEKTTDSLDQDEKVIVNDVFLPAPMHILQAQYTVLNYESVDAVILKEAARFFAENKLDFAILVDEGRLRRVLELGIQAFYAEEGEKNG